MRESLKKEIDMELEYYRECEVSWALELWEERRCAS
jgi:hypothetical protein